MKKYYLMCSIDGDVIDYEEEITADARPGFWECYEIAAAHGCEFFSLEEI